MKFLRRLFFSVFKMPETMSIFISAILLSAAINIATNEIGDKGIDWSYGWQVTFSVILMFLSSCCFTILAVYLKPMQERHKKDHPISVRMENKDVWYEDIKKKNGARTVLSLLFLLTYLTLLFSILLLFWDHLEELWQNILSPQAAATQLMS